MRTPTLQQFKAFARSNYRAAETVCMAQAFAQLERERVDAYIKPLFDLYDFRVRPEWVERGRPERITDIERLYLTDLDAPEYLDFIEQCDVEHRKHGYKGPKGHCPALEAGHLLILAENALLMLGGELFDVDFLTTHGDDRRKALDLLLGACLKERKAA